MPSSALPDRLASACQLWRSPCPPAALRYNLARLASVPSQWLPATTATAHGQPLSPRESAVFSGFPQCAPYKAEDISRHWGRFVLPLSSRPSLLPSAWLVAGSCCSHRPSSSSLRTRIAPSRVLARFSSARIPSSMYLSISWSSGQRLGSGTAIRGT